MELDHRTVVEEQLLAENRRLRQELKGLQKTVKTLKKESVNKSRKLTKLKKEYDNRQHYKNGKRGRRF